MHDYAGGEYGRAGIIQTEPVALAGWQVDSIQQESTAMLLLPVTPLTGWFGWSWSRGQQDSSDSLTALPCALLDWRRGCPGECDGIDGWDRWASMGRT